MEKYLLQQQQIVFFFFFLDERLHVESRRSWHAKRVPVSPSMFIVKNNIFLLLSALYKQTSSGTVPEQVKQSS